ncbi:MarR family winged helix-turn-helix transcriptional regulator [Niveispirillum irakense]|uniref:MarR family winged helix-turn-helix transcriptional regulator n=1 Tax=Niveispirillum irakense TaxID=34011 RepID=UPI0004097A28|nr:MarR family transcriptional regulator [Niveispirillum irakense]
MVEPRTDAALRGLRRIMRAAEMAERRLASETGLTPSQLLLLQEVARRGEATPSSLAAAVQFSQATVTNLADRLEALGLVARRRGDQDRRQIWVSITPKGRQILETAPDMLQAQFSGRFQNLPDWEQAMIVAMLERLGSLLDAEKIDAAPLLDTGRIDRVS